MQTVKLLSTWALLLLLACRAYSQSSDLYTYQDLSHIYYQKLKDSIKKAWVCPEAFPERAAQKKYREIWDSRTDFLLNAITHDDYVHDGEVYGYITAIVHQITEANRSLVPVDPLVLLDRSPEVNAYSIGGNVISVNLGLITFSNTREELAFAIAHELSHNILHHYENALQERAAWLSSDEYRQSMNDVLNSKYDRLTRLRKILENFTFSRSRHQRYHEGEADSLAIILLKKTNMAFDARFFLRLDSSDDEYHQRLHQPLQTYFTAYQLPYEDSWTVKRSHGLSTHNYNFTDTTIIEDSLKTHPDCPERYTRTLAQSTPHAQLTPIPASVKDKATKMLIWNLYSSSTLTPCLYRILLEKDKGSKDPWYDFMLSNIFAGLYYSDRELNRFNAIGVMPKEYISKDYYALQNLLEQIPRDNLMQYCKTLQGQGFWNGLHPDEKELKSFMFTLALDPDISEKNKQRAAKAFSSANTTSMYCELAQNFEK